MSKSFATREMESLIILWKDADIEVLMERRHTKVFGVHVAFYSFLQHRTFPILPDRAPDDVPEDVFKELANTLAKRREDVLKECDKRNSEIFRSQVWPVISGSFCNEGLAELPFRGAHHRYIATPKTESNISSNK